MHSAEYFPSLPWCSWYAKLSFCKEFCSHSITVAHAFCQAPCWSPATQTCWTAQPHAVRPASSGATATYGHSAPRHKVKWTSRHCVPASFAAVASQAAGQPTIAAPWPTSTAATALSCHPGGAGCDSGGNYQECALKQASLCPGTRVCRRCQRGSCQHPPAAQSTGRLYRSYHTSICRIGMFGAISV